MGYVICLLLALGAVGADTQARDPTVARGRGTALIPPQLGTKGDLRQGSTGPVTPAAYREAIDRAVADAVQGFLGSYLSPRALAEAEPLLTQRMARRPEQFVPQVKVLSVGAKEGIVSAEVEARISLSALRGALVEVIKPRTILFVLEGQEDGKPVPSSVVATRVSAGLKELKSDFIVIDPGELEILFRDHPELRRALGGERNASELGLRVLAELVCVGTVRVWAEETFLPGVYQGMAEADVRVLDCKSTEVTAALTLSYRDPIGARRAEAVQRARQAIFREVAKALVERVPSRPVEGLRVSCDLGPIYAALLNGYRSYPFGEIRLVNQGRETLGPLRVRVVFDKQLLIEPFVVTIRSLEPGQERVIPVRARLSDSVISLGEREIGATVAVEKRPGEPLRKVRRAVLVHQPNVFSWREPEAIAAYVDPDDPVLKALVSNVWRNLPAEEVPTPELIRACGVWGALRSAHLRYRRDPTTFSVSVGSRVVNDRVNYPGQTLSEGAGDCDDFAVLASAAFEAAGVESAVVVTRDHVLVACETGFSSPSFATRVFGPDGVVVHNGKAYLVLEATALGKDGSFTSAWEEALGAVKAVRRGEAQLVVINEAWKIWKPVLHKSTGSAREDIAGSKQAAQLVRSELEAFRKWILDRIKKAADKLAAQGTASAFKKAGTLYGACGLVEEARACFKKALGEGDTFAVHFNLGELLLFEGRKPKALSEAIAEFQRALGAIPAADLPARADTLLRLALAYRLAGDTQAEKRYLAQAYAINPALKKEYEGLFDSSTKSGPGGVGDRVRRFLLRQSR